MVAVSVVVVARDPGTTLPGLLRSIDAQSLPWTEFELIVVDATTDDSRPLLRRFADHRPDVVVLAGDRTESDEGLLLRGLEHCSGERVLALDRRLRLAPRALELLLERGRDARADTVLGRIAAEDGSGRALPAEDLDRFDRREHLPSSRVALLRRSQAAEEPDPGAVLLGTAELPPGSVAVLGRYACALGAEAKGSAPVVPIGPPDLRWADAVLRVSVTTGGHDAETLPSRAWLVLARDDADLAVPAAVTSTASGGANVDADLDPATALQGGPLDDGVWELRLRLEVDGREQTVPLRAVAARPAVVAGRPHVAGGGRGALRLDVGATRTALAGRVPIEHASIVESARGLLLTLRLAELHTCGRGVLDASVLLGGFGVPGRLVCEPGAAAVEAYVGTLAGTSEIRLVTGGGKPRRTGLELRVDGVGRALLATVAPPEPRPVPLVQRVRRRAPSGLEPLVRRLAGVPLLRRVYRGLLNR